MIFIRITVKMDQVSENWHTVYKILRGIKACGAYCSYGAY